MGGGFAALAALFIGAVLAWRQHKRRAAVCNLELSTPMDSPIAAQGPANGGGLPVATVQKQGSADSRDPLLRQAQQTGVLQLLSCCLGNSWDSAVLHADLVR